ncbi:helix-turn-helix transcriptional regulator [Streptomyces thermocarboxydovorans]|uniref:Helix-turn-helix transcriptional regulator n=2 Tax=Streptomyces thermocarboxydovorans TaxID=59298 RepID=A0ABN1H8L7_9ACTN
MPLDLARHVDRVLGTDGFFERHCEHVRRARRAGHASYFEHVLEMERRAKSIEEWCPSLFPGLLQTAAYARAVVQATHPLALDDEVEPKVSARIARAAIFEEDHHTPSYWVILHESLLVDPILAGRQMAEQLDRVVELTERRRIVPQILLRTSGPHPFMVGTAMLLTFADAPPLVYTESLHSGVTIDDPALVEEYRKSYYRLRAVALSPEASLARIKAAAEDYRHGEQPDRPE